jgi:hypothetical protein
MVGIAQGWFHRGELIRRRWGRCTLTPPSSSSHRSWRLFVEAAKRTACDVRDLALADDTERRVALTDALLSLDDR